MMSAWWNGLSLKSKLQLPIQLLLLVVMIVAQRAILDKYESGILESAREKALVSADGVLNGLNMLMINGIISQEDQRELFIKKMGASNKVNELRVIRNKPVQDQFGPGMPRLIVPPWKVQKPRPPCKKRKASMLCVWSCLSSPRRNSEVPTA
jgi:methyl-accepting chemotaxis protein